MPYSDKEKQRKYQMLWARRNRSLQRDYMRKIRTKVISLLGGKCSYCGCTTYEALEINHKNGGGKAEIRKVGKKSFLLSILNGKRERDDLEIACRVCNALHYLKDVKKLVGKWKVTWEK